MKIINLLGYLGLYTLSLATHAGDEKIQLEGGQAQPNEAFTLILNKLPYGIKYGVSCSMHGKYRRPLTIQALGSEHVPVIHINGVDVSPTDGVIKLIYPLNSLNAYDATKGGLVIIHNLDLYDTLTIENCVATLNISPK